MENDNKELSVAIETIMKKIENVTSEDGNVTVTFNGVGDFTDIKINCFLEEISKDKLEDDILEAINTARDSLSKEIYGTLMNYVEDAKAKAENKDNKNESDDFEVTIKNVS